MKRVSLFLRREEFRGDRSLLIDAIVRATGCDEADLRIDYGLRGGSH